jgi:uroporphyrin-III C-methyltransferase/precorrin-2 dehydrogenase/sirohydrochlorin ferrochelatase
VNPLFPLFLKLRGRRVLLVGGGRVAAGKLNSLLDASALVTVVSPQIRPELDRPGVSLLKRPFTPADIDGVWFVIAAATPEINRAVSRAAEERRIFVNAVDDPENATVYTGAVLRRGGVTLAVSTEGDAPAVAGLLREGLASLLPDDIGRWIFLSRVLRRSWQAQSVPFEKRRPLLLDAINKLYEQKALERSA